MNWGRLIGGAFLSRSLDATRRCIPTNHDTFCGFKSTHNLRASICSLFRENPESNNYELEEKAKRGLDSDLMIQTANCAKERKNVEKQKRKQAEEKLMNMRNGDMINLYNFLFTKKRDYLVKYNNQQVKAEQLAGKIIVVYFMPLPPNSLDERMSTTFLMDT